MIKLCATVALLCAMTAPASASTTSGYEKSAEARAKAAVAPLVVERVFCVRQSRRRVLCLLAHPDAGGRSCRSTVLVRPRRVRVIQRSVCFEIREVKP